MRLFCVDIQTNFFQENSLRYDNILDLCTMGYWLWSDHAWPFDPVKTVDCIVDECHCTFDP